MRQQFRVVDYVSINIDCKNKDNTHFIYLYVFGWLTLHNNFLMILDDQNKADLDQLNAVKGGSKSVNNQIKESGTASDYLAYCVEILVYELCIL